MHNWIIIASSIKHIYDQINYMTKINKKEIIFIRYWLTQYFELLILRSNKVFDSSIYHSTQDSFK
jgi:hypothetical protein